MEPFTDLFQPRELVTSIWQAEQLPDARLFSRLRRSVEMLVERLEAPASVVPRKLRVGALRFWNNDRVAPESLIEPMLAHQAGMLRDAAVLLVAHDTMEIDLAGRYRIEDAGPLRSTYAAGHLLHWGLAVDPVSHRPLAALSCEVWTRPKETRNGDHATRAPEDRESIKWKRGILAVQKLLQEQNVTATVTHVFDREGDMHDNFTFATSRRLRVLTRAAQDHSIAEEPRTLFKLLAAQEPWERESIHTREVPTKENEEVLREARKAGRAQVTAVRAALRALRSHREAKLRVRWTEVTLTPDLKLTKAKRRPPVRVWVVQVAEQNAPAEVASLSWVLLTTVPIETERDALWAVDSYRDRWPIEPMHSVLKTGLHVEEQGVKDVSSTRRLLAVLLPVSLHLMRWTYGWQQAPQELARAQVPSAVLAALKAVCRFRSLPLPRREWTIKDVVLRLAALGGYERRPDRTPGWLVVWRGWRELLHFWRVVQFAKGAATDDLPDNPPPNLSWKPRGT